MLFRELLIALIFVFVGFCVGVLVENWRMRG